MINVEKKEKCCGCTACANVCPVQCISMQPDSEGFMYPVVDKSVCIECGKCERVCPVLNSEKSGNNYDKKCFLARTKDNAVLMEGTSGGVGTTLALDVVKKEGIAYGAVFDENFRVVHKGIDNTKDIVKFSGSKYVQSDLTGVFERVKNELSYGKRVIFTGTPCQIYGLKNYLGKDYDNLLLVDLVCHGVPSPKIWENYIQYLNNKYGRLKYANFRKKAYGYHVTTMEEVFENNKRQLGSARTNLMLKCFFKNIADRPICYECPFKTLDRCSDITLFDGWHAKELVKGLEDDDKGYTNVIIHTIKGEEALLNNRELESIQVDLNKAIQLDGSMMFNSVKKHPQREAFYKMFNELGIEEAVKEFLTITKKDKFIESCKLILFKIGVIKHIKSIKSKLEKRGK